MLKLTGTTWLALDESRRDSASFRYVVNSTQFRSTWSLALIFVDVHAVGACLIRKHGRPNLRQDDLAFQDFQYFDTQPDMRRLLDDLPRALRAHVERLDGAPLPPSTNAAFQAAVLRAIPNADAVLRSLASKIQRQEAINPSEQARHEQRDAIALGMEVAGLDSRAQLEASEATTGSSLPFLTDFRRTRTSEAAMIRHDSMAFDGWLETYADAFDVTGFVDPKDPARRVAVLYADKERLENQTGTDLLYYRHHRPGFILVQYKRMRLRRGGAKATYEYYPNHSLSAEIARARTHTDDDSSPRSLANWRLSGDAVFVKLVREDMARPKGNRLVQGMYLPLSLVELLLEASESGKRRKAWTQDGMEAYLSNEEFLVLARQGYIGTTSGATDRLKAVVANTFEQGRGLVVVDDHTDAESARKIRHG